MDKQSVLFVCIHNSARSQMAEELLRKMAHDRFTVESAGLEPGKLNPIVVRVLLEEGIDIAAKKTQAVANLLKEGKQYDFVVTVCDEASAEKCPAFPGEHQRMHWGFPDPSAFKGSDQEKLTFTREVKEAIKARLASWLQSSK